MNTGCARGGKRPRRCRPFQGLCLVMRTGWKRRALPSPIARWPRRWVASIACCCRSTSVAGPARASAGEEEAELCAALQLTGRKALLARWRQEAADALRFLDAARAEALHQQVANLQFFN